MAIVDEAAEIAAEIEVAFGDLRDLDWSTLTVQQHREIDQAMRAVGILAEIVATEPDATIEHGLQALSWVEELDRLSAVEPSLRQGVERSIVFVRDAWSHLYN